jgi:hypothetical protein
MSRKVDECKPLGVGAARRGGGGGGGGGENDDDDEGEGDGEGGDGEGDEDESLNDDTLMKEYMAEMAKDGTAEAGAYIRPLLGSTQALFVE